MTTEKINIETALKGTPQVEQLVKTLKEGSAVAKAYADRIKQLSIQLNNLNPRALTALGKTMAQGSPASFIRNSATTGQIKDFEAQLTNVTSRVINRFSKGMNDAIKAANSIEVLKLKGTPQSLPSGNLQTLNTQILAQQARVSERLLQVERLRGAAADTVNKKAMEEKVLLDNLLMKRKELLAIEKTRQAQASLATATAINNAKAQDPLYQQSLRNLQQQRILGDGGASLFKIQAQLLVNYMLMNKVFQLFQFGTGYVIDFDKALKDLQAITATTNTEMEGLAETIVEVSTKTKFSAIEIAKAATIMGQAGFSAPEIKDSIESVTLLATATGSDLTTAVDVATSALTVFNMNASEMSHVADVMTGALNLSKLTMDKLALGIQYAGNTASEAGLNLEEFVAALGAISNAGIKSGSTIGTGLSQLIIELQAPTQKLTKELASVGLTLADVDIKAKGLVGVLETLQEAGFNSANAFNALDLRGARAYLALSRNVDTLKQLQSQLILTNAAAEANARQMESLANSGAKLSNTFGEMVLKFGEPIKKTLITLTNLTSGFLSVLNQLPVILPAIGIAFSSLIGAAVLIRIGTLIKQIFQLNAITAVLGTTSGTAAVGVRIFGVATLSAAASTKLWGQALIFLGATPLGRLASILAIATAGIWAWSAATDAATNGMDELQAKVDASSGRYKEHQDTIDAVGREVERLIGRYANLSKDTNAMKDEVLSMQLRFGQFSDKLRTDTITSVDELISVLRELQGVMRELQVSDLDTYIKEQTYLNRKKTREVLEEAGKANFIDPITGKINRASDPAKNVIPPEVFAILNKYKDVDLETIDVEGLVKLQDAYSSVLGKYKTLDGLLLAEGTRLLQAGKSTKEVDEYRATLKNISAKTGGLLATARDVYGKSQEKLMLENASLFDNEVTKLDQLGKDLAIAKSAYSKATGTQAKRVALAAVKKSQAALKAYQEDYAKDIESTIVTDIANKTGLSRDVVKHGLDNRIGDKLASYASEAEAAIRQQMGTLADGTADFFDKYTELQKLAINRLEKEIAHSTDKIKLQIDAIDSTITETNDRRSRGQNPIYSDQELRLMGDKQKQLQTAAIQVEIDKTKELLPLLRERVNYEEMLLKASVEAYEDSKGTKGEGRALKAMVEAQRDYDDAREKQIGIEYKLAELENQRIARMRTTTDAQMSLTDSIEESVKHYMDVLNIQNDFRLNIDKNVTHVLDEASGAFTDFVTNVATGSKSVGDSFRDMAGRIIKAMLDIAAQQAATGLFSLFGGLFKSLVGGITGGATSAAAPIQGLGQISVSDLPSLNSGGYVRRYAAGGYNPNRDSRPAILRPGEYVLRNSAVDMIGREALDQINASGNNKVSRSVGAVAQMAPNGQVQLGTPVNVYVTGPDFKPSLTKGDVVATIDENIARGGSTVKLIKQVIGGLR